MYSLIWHNCTWVVFTNLLEIEVSGDPNSRTTIILLILLLMIMFIAFTFTYQPITLPIPLFENFLFLILVTCKWMNLWHRTSILQQAVRKDLLIFLSNIMVYPRMDLGIFKLNKMGTKFQFVFKSLSQLNIFSISADSIGAILSRCCNILSFFDGNQLSKLLGGSK